MPPPTPPPRPPWWRRPPARPRPAPARPPRARARRRPPRPRGPPPPSPGRRAAEALSGTGRPRRGRRRSSRRPPRRSTTTPPGAGSGSGRSSTRSSEGGPSSWQTTARTGRHATFARWTPSGLPALTSSPSCPRWRRRPTPSSVAWPSARFRTQAPRRTWRRPWWSWWPATRRRASPASAPWLGGAHLEQLSVHPDHGRRGIGRALVRAAVELGGRPWLRRAHPGHLPRRALERALLCVRGLRRNRPGRRLVRRPRPAARGARHGPLRRPRPDGAPAPVSSA